MEGIRLNTQHMSTTKRFLSLALCAALVTTIAMAHGGLEHIMGTVAKISDTTITVKTTAGKMVEVGLNAKTVFSKAEKPIPRAEIKPGDRVVIHAEKSGTGFTAHTVEIGTASATTKTASK